VGNILTLQIDCSNRNAKERSLTSYIEAMESLVGPGKPFVKEEVFEVYEAKAREDAVALFNNFASIGNKHIINQCREKLIVSNSLMGLTVI
jgi:hypothetical protein